MKLKVFKLSDLDWDGDDEDGSSGDSDAETAGAVKSKKSEIKVSKWVSS